MSPSSPKIGGGFSVGFAAGFVVSYIVIFALELPVPGYYPLTGEWSFSNLTADSGTVMHWYGLTAEALLVGAITGLLNPGSVWNRIPQQAILGLVWTVMLGCVWVLRAYFV